MIWTRFVLLPHHTNHVDLCQEVRMLYERKKRKNKFMSICILMQEDKKVQLHTIDY